MSLDTQTHIYIMQINIIIYSRHIHTLYKQTFILDAIIMIHSFDSSK